MVTAGYYIDPLATIAPRRQSLRRADPSCLRKLGAALDRVPICTEPTEQLGSSVAARSLWRDDPRRTPLCARVKVACRYQNWGGAAVAMALRTAPSPKLGKLVFEVAAIPLSSGDAIQAQGKYVGGTAPPFVPGHDFAGRVVEVGDDVDSSMIGRRVHVLLPYGGAMADHGAFPADWAMERPLGWTTCMLRLSPDLSTLKMPRRLLIRGACAELGDLNRSVPQGSRPPDVPFAPAVAPPVREHVTAPRKRCRRTQRHQPPNAARATPIAVLFQRSVPLGAKPMGKKQAFRAI